MYYAKVRRAAPRRARNRAGEPESRCVSQVFKGDVEKAVDILSDILQATAPALRALAWHRSSDRARWALTFVLCAFICTADGTMTLVDAQNSKMEDKAVATECGVILVSPPPITGKHTYTGTVRYSEARDGAITFAERVAIQGR